MSITWSKFISPIYPEAKEPVSQFQSESPQSLTDSTQYS